MSAAKVGNNAVRLIWRAVGYNVYRDGAQLAAGIRSNAYQDGTVARNKTYVYTVRAVAPNGNAGPASAALSVTTR